MSDNQQNAPRMSAITISRQYGSGGGEVAARLAQRLQWQLIDHEIVAEVARELGMPEEEAEVHDERSESFISRVLGSMQLASPELLANAPIVPLSPGTQEQLYHQALRRVVETAANTGNAVIVGRAGQVLLAKRRDVLHVRIVAPFEQRLRYVMQREGLDEADARARIQQKDRDRSRHLQSQYHRDVNDPLLYDLVLNSGVLDLESLVDLIVLALERKARRLVVKTSELGAAVGLTPYPGRPADLYPPLPASPAAESEQST
jgi:CMP/dCMP kinase